MAVIGLGLGIAGAVLIGLSIYFSLSEPEETTSSRTVIRYASGSQSSSGQRSLPTLTPTPLPETATPTPSETATPTVAPTQTETPTVAAGVEQSGSDEFNDEVDEVEPTATPTATAAPPTPTATSLTLADTASESQGEALQATESYTSTDQVQPPPSTGSEDELAASSVCPTTSEAFYDLIPIEGKPLSIRPDYQHADLNLALRGYSPVSETLTLEFYNGNTDPNAPQLHGLFEPNRVPQFIGTYQVNEWIWDASECNGSARGCRGEPVDEFWPVTLVGAATTPGEPIYIPERGPQIYSGGFVNLVIYAEEHRVTLAYTRRDSVAAGYTVHIENICVDPNLLALYRSQRNVDGRHASGYLPALRNNQSIGVALNTELQVAIRDAGTFMDPRSEKDWWRQ